MKSNPVPTLPHKYYLKSLISRLSNETGAPKRHIKQELATAMDISYSQLTRIINYRVGETKSMNTDQLLIAAEFLGVSIEDLINPIYRNEYAGKKKAEKEKA